jgi:hypothetical protein
MTATLPDVAAKKNQEPTAEAQVAAELVRQARERGLPLTGPDGGLVVALRARHVVASTRTGAGGRFQLSVDAGRYVIRATNTGGLATIAQKTVDVAAGATIRVRLVVDSGIR